MKVTKTIDRECCEPEDFKRLGGPEQPRTYNLWGRSPSYVFCIHCGRRHTAQSFTDAAGSQDWAYRPETNGWPWEIKK